MENVTTKLRVVIVSEKRRLVKEIMSECNFYNDDSMPRITIKDCQITNMFGYGSYAGGLLIHFYDIKNDRFNFNVSNLTEIIKSSEQVPSEIQIEFLEVGDSSGKVRYIQLEPGLWKEDEFGKYRMCDNAIRHIIMDSKIIPMIESNQIGWNDGAAITLLAYLENNLEFKYFGDREEIDNDEWECDEDDSEVEIEIACIGCNNYNKGQDICECNKCKDCANADNCMQPCYKHRNDDNCNESDCGSNCNSCNKQVTHKIDDSCSGNCDKCCNEGCEVWDTCECGKSHKEYLDKMKNNNLNKVMDERILSKHQQNIDKDEQIYPKFMPINPFYGKIEELPTDKRNHVNKHKPTYRRHSRR